MKWKSPSSFLERRDTAARGRVGQREAEAEIIRRGFEIVARNWRSKAGEIDLIAVEGETLCFIEVKARSQQSFGHPLAAVHTGKQRRIARAARLYLASHPFDGPCRFDVLGLELMENRWRYHLIRDAFHAG